jgi:hypothetical protein
VLKCCYLISSEERALYIVEPPHVSPRGDAAEQVLLDDRLLSGQREGKSAKRSVAQEAFGIVSDDRECFLLSLTGY